MRSVANIAQGFNPGSTQIDGQAASSRPVPEAAVTLVNNLFADLQVIFPAWRVAFPTQSTLDNAKRTWTLALFENGIHHGAQIKAGLRKARASGSPHMPSVGQFMSWCRPSRRSFAGNRCRRCWKPAWPPAPVCR